MKKNFTKYGCLLTLGLLGTGAGALAQAPANDNCSGAVSLTINATCIPVSGTTTGATSSTTTAPDPDCGNNGWDDDVWYTFTPQAGQTAVNIAFSSTGGDDDMAAQLYSSTTGCAGQFTAMSCSDDDNGTMPAFSQVALTPGTTYYIRLYTYGTGTNGDFTVCVSIPPPPPANNDCVGATSITPSANLTCSPVSGTTENATHSNEIAVSTNDDGTNDDVWYSFVAGGPTHYIELNNLDGSSTDMSMAVYSGSCGALTELQYSDPETMTVTGLTTGTTYYLRVWTYSSGPGDYASFDVCITTPPPPPANDLPANATTILVDQPCTSPYTNVSATVATDEPGAACTGATENYATVWFKFTAPASGAVKITTDFAGYVLEDTRVALFSVGNATNYSSFQSLACDEDNGITGDGYYSILYAAGLTVATDYYIVVDQYSSSTTSGTFCLEVNTLTDAMLPVAGACTDGQQNGASDQYMGWLSFVDNDGKLIANVRPNPAATYIDNYFITPSLNIHQGIPRQDANGLMYLNRNSFYLADIEDTAFNTITAADMDLQLFFTQTELTDLGASLANLNVTHMPGSTCSGDFAGDGTQTALIASGNGSSGNAAWINITTPGFSNFYLMNGTTPLPIDLRSIAAANTGNSNRVDWSTAKEDPGEYFELERSADSKAFSFLSRINGKGQGSDYTYRDGSPLAGTSFYRLKMVNNDGGVMYSKVVSATVIDKAGFSLQASPNPVQHSLNVNLKGERAANAMLTLSDITGKTLRSYSVNGEEIRIDMSSLAQGLYLLHYVDDNRKETVKISKQ